MSGLAASASSTADWISESSRTRARPRSHHLLGSPRRRAHPRRPGEPACSTAALVDQGDDGGHLGGVIGSASRSRPLSLALLLGICPTGAGSLAGSAMADGGRDQVHRAGVDQIAHHLVGDRPFLLNPLAGQPREAPDGAAQPPAPVRRWGHRPRSGSGIPVVLGGLPLSRPGEVWPSRKVPGLLVHPPAGFQAPPAGASVADGHLGPLQRVDVLSGAGAELGLADRSAAMSLPQRSEPWSIRTSETSRTQ